MQKMIDQLTIATNLGLMLAMGMVPASSPEKAHVSKGPENPNKTGKNLSQISTIADQKHMEKVRSADLFSKCRDLINDLIFDPWSTKKAIGLRETLGSMNSVPSLEDDKDNTINIILERVEKLAGIRVKYERTQSSQHGDRLSEGHDALIKLIDSCFKK